MARKKPSAARRANASSGNEPTAATGHASSAAELARMVEELHEANERLAIANARLREEIDEARRREADWNALLNGLTEGVIVVDAAERLVLANPVAREMVTLPPIGAPIAGRDWVSLDLRDLSGQPLSQEARPLRRAIRGECFDDYEVLLTRLGGDVRRFAFNGSSVRDGRGEILLAMVTFRDVTELRRLERTKEEYISLVSHDLRGPLTIILGQAQLLARFSSQLKADAIEAIIRNSRRMNDMIQDLLDTARLEAGQGVFHPERCNLRLVIAAAIESVASAQDRARIRFQTTEPVPPVYADRRGIERVMMNLIANALKFSSDGSPVELDLRSSDREVIVSISDYGVGISREALPHLFEKYFRTATGKARGGLGLGLYLSKLIVEASGGSIWATSQLGRGSTFSFSLPIA